MDANSTVLVVEGEPDHRHFLLDYFGSRCRVIEASTGARALEICLEATPQMVFVGAELGVVDAPTLTRKLRGIETLSETHIVASVPRNQLAGALASGVFDAVMARSFVVGVFEDQFERLTARADQLPTAIERLHPRFGEAVLTAIEQVFGMALTTEVEVRGSDPAPAASDDVLTTTLTLALPHKALTRVFELLVSTTAADELAARMTDQPAGGVTTEDRDSAVAEISNMIVGRLHNTLGERGIAGRIGLPTTALGATRQAPTDNERPTTIHFWCGDCRAELWLLVAAEHDECATDHEQAA